MSPTRVGAPADTESPPLHRAGAATPTRPAPPPGEIGLLTGVALSMWMFPVAVEMTEP